MAIAYLGLGSNVGDRSGNIQRALDMLDKSDRLNILAISSLYETEPEGYEDQDWFVNAAAQIETNFSPRELLRLFKEVEGTIGRRESVRWGPREIDLDLLLYDNIHLEDSNIVVPHPRMQQRAFVLVPLAEIAPEALHPVLNKTVGTLLSELRTSKTVRQLNMRATRRLARP